jgi:peroxiredoxin
MELKTTTFALESGALAPAFHDLLATDGRRYSLESFSSARHLAMVFISNGCPTVRAYEERLTAIHERYSPQGAQLVTVNSNNPHLSPGDSYPEMERWARERRFPFPYLKDSDGEVARAYGGICTPHVFVFDGDRRLRYRGRIDDGRDPARVTSPDLDNALRDLVTGVMPAVSETDPFGCSIVW